MKLETNIFKCRDCGRLHFSPDGLGASKIVCSVCRGDLWYMTIYAALIRDKKIDGSIK